MNTDNRRPTRARNDDLRTRPRDDDPRRTDSPNYGQDRPDEFAGIGQVARPGNDAPEASPQTTAPASLADRRAAAVGEAIDAACTAIVSEIDGLIERATALREWYIDDASRTKLMLRTHIGAGSRVVELTTNIKDELKNLEDQRAEIETAQTK